MPTPVSAARQCLTDEAARALDDAVAVARRRCHAQTTSLHAVSAFLALPSSALRDACSRARSCAYPPRLQFRALELSVGVSLDRLPSSKAVEEPPVSNSLMAAIKRSQANQRRHPESFHLHQIHSQQQTASVLKVELKYFILSILDDPIVSRVFGEAGFRSSDIKLAIMHPPVSQTSRLSRGRCPPIFLCNLTDFELGQRNFSFPSSGGFGLGDDDANCRRIGEVLVKRTGKNPLLIGVCASDALRRFTQCVQRCKSGLLPAEISGLRVICIEREISDFVVGRRSKESIDLKFKEVFVMVQHCSGPGMVVNYGELSSLVSKDVVDDDALSFVVSQLTGLLKLYSAKVWLIGAAGTYEMHENFLACFPTIEKDWDLHLLPITSKSSGDGLGAKSSLMGSFVPFGGFFPSQSDFPQLSSPNQPFTRCQQCTEKYEQEIAAVWKVGSSAVSDRYSESSLPVIEVDTKSKELEEYKTGDDRIKLSDTVLGLQKKWNDICHLHQRQLFPLESSATGESSVLGNPCSSRDVQRNLNTKHGRQVSEISDTCSDAFQSKIVTEVSQSREAESLQFFPDKLSSSPLISVTTDLGLGTLYASTSEKKRKVSELESKKDCIQHLSGSNRPEFNTLSEINPCRSPGCSDPNAVRPLDTREFKSLWNVLNEKVGWQGKATSTIIETILRCRTGSGRRRSWNLRGDIWLTFLGPDKIGKRKISLTLAEAMFGSRESLISVDFSLQRRDREPNSLFHCKDLDGFDERFRGKTVVDFIAEELSRKPYSVVLLENVDKADIQAKSCLSQAITTGKFSDSRGRRITINNTIFVTTSAMTEKVKNTSYADGEDTEFSEEKILAAKNCQMQISVGGPSGDAGRVCDMNVRVTGTQGNSKLSFLKNRKLTVSTESTEEESSTESQKKMPMSYLDLNLPVEETEDEIKDGECDSDSISEGSETWLEDFLEQVDEKVVFEPYNFDELAKELVEEIDSQLRRVFGSEVILEIDYKTMVQILAANWLSDEKRGVKNWVEQVLHRSFVETKQKYQLTSGSVMKLTCIEDGLMEEQTPGLCLPARIVLY